MKAVLGNYYSMKKDVSDLRGDHSFIMSINLRNDEFAIVVPRGSDILRRSIDQCCTCKTIKKQLMIFAHLFRSKHIWLWFRLLANPYIARDMLSKVEHARTTRLLLITCYSAVVL